jgi:outer membrane cobalamin receptor
MKTIYYLLLLLLLLIPEALTAQKKLEGKITDATDNEDTGLAGANLVWAGTTIGTSANAAGYFSLKRANSSNRLVISFVGYKTDTIDVGKEETYLTHKLNPQNLTEDVVVFGKSSGTYINRIDPVLTVNITGAELCKAACCNLSESFETNASVDVNYSDASTGAKQIQLLGLAGSYTQILAENIPVVYGLSSAYGLNYIPGPWMESIQVSKGTSSVRNGYESMAGQINVEFKKPSTSEIVYVNGFISNAGRQEMNANASVILNSNLSTMLLVHSELQNGAKDHNHDGFRDEPDIRQYNLFNRWDYIKENFTFRAGIKYLEEERIGGQFSYKSGSSDTWNDGFGIKIGTKRIEGFTKIGVVFPEKKNMSIGWIQNIANHQQNSWFGFNRYDGTQNTYFSSLLYQWIPGQGKHILDGGLSFKYDNYDENLDALNISRKESVPGIFAQYTYSDSLKFTAVAGIRTDFHNLYGTLVTPRIHLRYSVTPEITLRGSAGKGFRAGNVLAENTFLLASSREIFIASDLEIEEAWNSGISITGNIPIATGIVKLSAEYFHTDFINQIITDLDSDVNRVSFYNLSGRSYSNILQIEASTQIFEGFDLLAAWRWNDVRMTIDGTLREKPLTSRYKGLLTASWLTHLRKWQYDYTLQLNGPGRIPSTEVNPEAYRRSNEFDSYVIMNAQISRYFKRFQFYAGAENLTGFMQPDPIIAADDPFGDFFDSSLIWGPVHGRKLYAGFRFIIDRKL